MQHPIDLLEAICCRPIMYYGGMQTARELIAYLDAVQRGLAVAQGYGHGYVPELHGFHEFLQDRLANGNRGLHTSLLLLKAFGDMPLFDACGAIEKLVKEWKRQRDQPKLGSEAP